MAADYMQQAISLARKALGTVSPNPAVGAIVVSKNGKIAGRGYTQPPGSDHAEVMAIRQAGEACRGGTMYVTLEPCCHHGRTPPCTRAIINSGIREIHIATLDTNPLVSGKGKDMLESDGIRMHVGENEQEAKDLNEAYFKFTSTKTPFVTAKFAMSLDGKIATRSRSSRWITNEWSRERAHRIRWESDAIVVGINTIIKDNPELTARTLNGMREPLRVIVDSHGQTPIDARVLHTPDRVLIAATEKIPSTKLTEFVENGIEVLKLPEKDGHVNLTALFEKLGEMEVMSVLVEGGGTLMGSIFDQGLADKIMVFIAPIIIGGGDAVPSVAGEGVDLVSQALRLRRVSVERFLDDIMVIGYRE
ncbi:MAG: bifunctional diaminohydroxyphosphoribosylaminopyrimidine deaminase/5-amino-6-(5-phosphoribosylamino)uracil reductase RibD [Dehalococcoidia bacterium]